MDFAKWRYGVLGKEFAYMSTASCLQNDKPQNILLLFDMIEEP
jgi:hypothetical protein